MEEKIPDILFVEQNVVDEFLKEHTEYDVAQAHSGEHPYILAKKTLILKKIEEEHEKNPIIQKGTVIDITPLHTADDKFREYMIQQAKENNVVYAGKNKLRRYA